MLVSSDILWVILCTVQWLMDIWNYYLYLTWLIISYRLNETLFTAQPDATPVLLWKMKRVNHDMYVIILFSNSSLFFGGFLLFARYFGFDWAEETARSVICIKWIPLLSRMKGVSLSFSGWLSNKRIQSVIVNQTALTVKKGNAFSPYL